MVKHIILWQLKDEYSDTEKADIKAGIKAGLEGLAGQIPGLVEIHVNINGLPSSNADLMLDTTFESARHSRATPSTRLMWPSPTARCAPTIRAASAWITRSNFQGIFRTGRLFLCTTSQSASQTAPLVGEPLAKR